MRIIGIDPSPGKLSYLYSSDGFQKKDAAQLSRFLGELSASDEDVLICWDAPLTGAPDPDKDEFNTDDYTQRKIEAFFNRKRWGFKAPKGISVRGYANCPHWAISRRLVGLPRVGPWDAPWGDLRFKLIPKGSCPTRPGHFIVEVHPGVALWLWCNTPSWTAAWEYKKNKTILEQVWAELKKRLQNTLLPSGMRLNDLGFHPRNDDELDCFIAWLLGILWCQGSGEVILLGNIRTGSMLLPKVEGLEESFREFVLAVTHE
jgi:hypothetical protein